MANRTDDGDVLQVRNEIAVLKRVSMGHQNILTLVDYFETMNNCTLSPPPLLDTATPQKPGWLAG